MSLKVGTRLKSGFSTCEVIVIKGSDRDAALLCAGSAMAANVIVGTPASDGPRVELGKRYSDNESGIEVLCSKPGIGPLTFENRELSQNTAKPLPASD